MNSPTIIFVVLALFAASSNGQVAWTPGMMMPWTAPWTSGHQVVMPTARMAQTQTWMSPVVAAPVVAAPAVAAPAVTTASLHHPMWMQPAMTAAWTAPATWTTGGMVMPWIRK